MHRHRHQADGKLRAGDNWQKGMPTDDYMDSLLRHVMDVWLHHRGYPERAREDLKEALCAVLFNAQGLLFNTLLGNMQASNIDDSIVYGAVCPDCGGDHESGHQVLCLRIQGE